MVVRRPDVRRGPEIRKYCSVEEISNVQGMPVVRRSDVRRCSEIREYRSVRETPDDRREPDVRTAERDQTSVEYRMTRERKLELWI